VLGYDRVAGASDRLVLGNHRAGPARGLILNNLTGPVHPGCSTPHVWRRACRQTAAPAPSQDAFNTAARTALSTAQPAQVLCRLLRPRVSFPHTIDIDQCLRGEKADSLISVTFYQPIVLSCANP
jgi:hypothetical protein